MTASSSAPESCCGSAGGMLAEGLVAARRSGAGGASCLPAAREGASIDGMTRTSGAGANVTGGGAGGSSSSSTCAAVAAASSTSDTSSSRSTPAARRNSRDHGSSAAAAGVALGAGCLLGAAARWATGAGATACATGAGASALRSSDADSALRAAGAASAPGRRWKLRLWRPACLPPHACTLTNCEVEVTCSE